MSSDDQPAIEGAPPVLDVRRMDAFERDVRDEVVEVILDGFSADLSFLSRDRSRFTIAFRDDVRADMFFAAELDGRIVGVLACSDNTGRALPANRYSLRRGLGEVRGVIAAYVLGRQFNRPLPLDDGTGYIEWVATSPHARGKGVSGALFRHIMRQLPYESLVLEVLDANELDANENARRVYSALGFEEYDRRSAKGVEKLTYRERIYMRWSRDSGRTPGRF